MCKGFYLVVMVYFLLVKLNLVYKVVKGERGKFGFYFFF